METLSGEIQEAQLRTRPDVVFFSPLCHTKTHTRRSKIVVVGLEKVPVSRSRLISAVFNRPMRCGNVGVDLLTPASTDETFEGVFFWGCSLGPSPRTLTPPTTTTPLPTLGASGDLSWAPAWGWWSHEGGGSPGLLGFRSPVCCRRRCKKRLVPPTQLECHACSP